MNKKKWLSLIIASLALVIVLAGCGKKDEKSDSKQSTDDSKNSSEVTLTDAYGEVKVPANPKRVVALNMEDALLALDVKPAGQWAIGTTVYNYLQDDLKNVPKIEWNMPLEQVIDVEPDLIVFNGKASIPEGKYEEYKKVAPVFVLKDEDSFNWRQQVKVFGEILGKEKKAEEVLKDYEDDAQKASTEIKAKIGDKSVAMIWVVGGKFFVLEKDRFASNVVYEDLGLGVPAFINKLPTAEVSWSDTSVEALADLDADYIFLNGLETDEGFEILDNSSVWQGLKAVQAKQVYNVGDTSPWTVNGLQASEDVIDMLEDKLIAED